MIQGLVLFSGGLDSVIATHLLKNQGLSVMALYFVLPFYSGIGYSHSEIKRYAEALGVPLRIEEDGEEFLNMILDPSFGYGKNANPCIDCRIHRLKRARRIMDELGAKFIATGEVIGQRPMSQRLDCLHKIENNTDLKGFLIRPLSARLLLPTKLETEGIIDRERLMGISGRGRKIQLEYARRYGLVHSTPGGGCILTHHDPARRFEEMVSLKSKINLDDLKLLAWGRHFRISANCKVVVSRNESENGIVEKLVSSQDRFLYMAEIPGPVAILRGELTDENTSVAASILVRFSKARNDHSVNVNVFHEGNVSIINVKPASTEYCETMRI